MIVVVFNLWQLILKGGPMMWPIILLSLVALAVGMERIAYLSSMEKIVRAHKAHLLRSLQQGHIQQTLSLCESTNSPFSRIFKAALLKFGTSAQVITTAMEEVFIYETHRLKERMSILSFAINASVLMGLLGTAVGLTVVFHAVQVRSNVLNPLSVGDMAQGIWQALFSTIAGLMVCIFTFTVYSFCISRINNIMADLELAMAQSAHMLVQLAELNERVEQRGEGGST
ncbi:MAG: MotA/TolQ/ExbB proton channel family protein [Candidatus Omnitrophica bacterium]|nr:MotA/TolQ/ExbB proton channel family protein [Candidatus Omnitrophota bacterium]